MRLSRCVPLALLFAASAVAAGCDQLAEPQDQPDYVQIGSQGLLSLCQLAPSVKTSGVVGPLGGSVTADGATLTLPAGAVLEPTEFRLHVPSSRYAEVEIHANGEEHFQFLAPVVISIDYSRCDLSSDALTAWHIDPDTKALLENMGGVNDVLNQRVTFSTMHLSGYAIAN